jgi:hypothetical protein
VEDRNAWIENHETLHAYAAFINEEPISPEWFRHGAGEGQDFPVARRASAIVCATARVAGRQAPSTARGRPARRDWR